MYRKFLSSGLIILLILLAASYTLADEGMWLLNKLPMEQMKKLGLQLQAEQIYNPGGGGLADAVVMVGGGTGSFVSPGGLILTNHHVAFRALQQNSTPEHNYIKEGFLARTRADELPAPGYAVYITKGFKDVTTEVLSAVKEGMTDRERFKAIEKKSNELVAECEKAGDGTECRVVSMYDGREYYLFTYLKIRDVRLVYAPPRAVGEYGGDIDNWMWPRHTGDFAFLRAYVGPDGKPADYSKDNVPYKSEIFLPISTEGIKGGDFIMIMGYPGRTMRYRSSYSVKLAQNVRYPFRIRLFQELINLLEDASKDSPELAIKLSSRIKSFSNVLKNNQGMMEGLKKSNLLQRKIEMEDAFTDYLKRNPELEKKYGDILPTLQKLYEETEKSYRREAIFSFMTYASTVLGFATTIHKWSIEKVKPDLQRESQYMDRNIPEIKKRLERAQRNLDVPTDMKILEMFLKKATDLLEGQKIAAIEAIVQGKTGGERDKAIHEFVENLYARTKLASLEERIKMFDMSKEELDKQNDPFIKFAAELEKERAVIREKNEAFSGAVSKLRPRLAEGISQWRKTALYPDANRTIRLTYGTVKGYVPRDAVTYDYITSLKGVIEKHTGKEPFDAPAKLIELYEKKDYGNYVDKRLGDVPVNFLGTTDITGGNSGSPVMNAKGELVGLAFDGNYESMTSDWQFDDNITRTISVDARYILFITEKLDKADNVLKELTIH